MKRNSGKTIEEYVVLLSISVCIILTIFSFVMKILGQDVTFVNQLTYYIYGWTVCFGAAVAAKKGIYMAIDVVSARYNEHVQCLLKRCSDIIMAFLWLFLAAAGLALAISQIHGRNAAAPSLPLAVAYFAPVFGYSFAAWRSLLKIFHREEKNI